ncbi:MAG: lysophospholipid acyltransferase family protein [Fidelibacterota bacterium]|nr:MAG: lysophospholipid acyltransferase family protein [Candidatus Neomarinimicrobiota bacterium]
MNATSQKTPRFRPRLLGQLGRGLFATLFLFNRFIVRGEAYLAQALASNRPVFIGVWHARMIYPIWYMRRHRPLALVSQSSDGEIMYNLLKSLGYDTIRGSSTVGSREALRAMMHTLDEPDVIMMNAMDGPVGPAKVAKVGGLALAARKKAIIIPASGAASRRWVFKRSWDRFQIPKPFGRVIVQFGSPVEMEPDMDDQDLARLMAQQINRAEEKADALAAHLD